MPPFLTSFMLGGSFSLDETNLAPSLVDGMKILPCIMAHVIALVAVLWGVAKSLLMALVKLDNLTLSTFSRLWDSNPVLCLNAQRPPLVSGAHL